MDKYQVLIDNIAADCIVRWGEDEKTIEFGKKLSSFIFQLGNQRNVMEILIELVKHYNYYSRAKVNEIFIDFYNQINNTLNLRKDYTVYSVIEDGKKINSSSTLLEEFRLLNGISSDYGQRIGDLKIDHLQCIDNIIFFDDIIGTGSTVETFFHNNLTKLQNVNCYIFCIEILAPAMNRLNSYFQTNRVNCKIISHNVHEKVFDSQIIFGAASKEKEMALLSFETSLWYAGSRNILGYDNSQAIVSFFRNTPNNTISSFWCSKRNWEALFPRNSEKPAFMKLNKSKVRSNLKKNQRGAKNG